jgi:hypothetical protein
MAFAISILTVILPIQASHAVDTTAPTFASPVSSRQDGFSFVINNFVSAQTYSAVTTKGYVMLGNTTFTSGYSGSSTNLVGIVYGLNKGEAATVTVTTSRSGYTDTSSQISGSAVAAPTVTACSPTSTSSGGYTTLKFTATSETVDRFCDWTVPPGVESATTVVIVGGGGGGGYWGNAGSGGAGAVLTRSNYPLTAGSVIRVVVGAGGGATFEGTGMGPGHNGNNSIFNGVIAAGGGGAGGGDLTRAPRFCDGFKGGSGGGTNSNNGCAISAGSSIASEVCGCSATWTVYGNAGSGQSGGSAGGSGAGVSILGLTFGTQSSVSASTGNSGAVQVAGSSGVVILKLIIPLLSTVSVSATSSSLNKGLTTQLTATASEAGIVRFYANGKRIAGCLSVPTSASPTFAATCNWRPTVGTSQIVYATFKPTNAAVQGSSSAQIRIDTSKRKTLR